MTKQSNMNIICSKCKSENIIKWTKRKTENRGLIQRYKCNNCNKTFTLDDGFFRMRNAPQKVTCAMDLFYRGVSTRKVQEHFKAFYPHNADHTSILRWIRKYSVMISKFTGKLKLNVGAEVQIDEVEYHRRKSHKKKLGIDKNWFIDSICPQTKFIVASNYVQSRNMKEIKSIIKNIKTKTESQVKIITSDGWLAYPDAIKKVYGFSNKTHSVNVVHNIVTASKGDGFNYPIERLHNNLRARTKIMRGFHGSVESANAILKGFEIYYNFITKHQTINKCPYELATDLKLNSENKWLELINLSQI
ncbi:IS1/IS6 family transposase [Candidatus Pacearchaeota archaeon]|nr:IS1/IS6 family transposase [Candidatus Pacearchaeota archaeon]